VRGCRLPETSRKLGETWAERASGYARRMLRWALSFMVVLACLGACSSTPLPPAPGSDAGSDGPVPDATPGDGPTPDTQTVTVFDAARISSDASSANFQRLTADIDLTGGPYQRVTLQAELGTTCFPFSAWQNDPPPSGQNFPADCDAFDRNFELALDEPEADSGAPPGLELVRAITPFGGPMQLEHDLTALANALPGPHRLSARINTYSDAAGLITGSNGGWDVSVRLELVKGAPPRQPLAIIPLFYGDLTTESGASASFSAPSGTRSAYIEYRTTGHGQAAGDTLQCNGPAEEFCKRAHTIQLDGTVLKTFTPWQSCASECTLLSDADAGFSYCAENPLGDVASVKAARAHWCPGSESPPIILDSPALAVPGAHELSWQVSEIAAGGSVRVSVTYYAFAD